MASAADDSDPAPTYSLAMSDAEVARYRLMAQMARDEEHAQWVAAGLVEGASVADLGCGPGLMLAELADLVGPTGRVAGVDRQPEALATAGSIIEDLGLAHASVADADAWASGLEPGSFDVVNIRHVLAHNRPADQARIVEHARDLLRPGGAIYVVDVDLTGGRVDPAADDMTDLLDRYVAHLADSGRDPTVGPTLGSLVRAAGFEQVDRWAHVQIPPPAALAELRPPAWAARDAMIESGHATADDVERWDRALTEFASVAATGDAAYFMPVYCVVARRPAT
jgi:SAM-dependent methyltransferase